MNKILLVEDNEMIIKGLKYMLEQNNFIVDVAVSSKESQEKINNNYDLIILDITLPDGNGLEIGKYIKENKNTPIMFLTAKDDEETIVEGLDLGAEDYIIKPFRTKELLSRIQNILRRSCANTILYSGDISVDIDKAEVRVKNEIVNLTSLEYKILSLLFMNMDKVVTRDTILEKIWDIAGNYVNDNTLSVYIKRIREKLHDEEIIKTIKGIGYRVDKK